MLIPAVALELLPLRAEVLPIVELEVAVAGAVDEVVEVGAKMYPLS
jgi:hypothetical protein